MLKVNKSYIFLLILSFLFAMSAGWEIPYLAFNIIISGFIISWLWARKVSKGLIINQRVKSMEYNVGDNISVQCFIDNDTILPVPEIEIIDRTTEKITKDEGRITLFSISPTGREAVTTNIKAKYRGMHLIGPVDVEVSDALGIFKFRRRVYSDTLIKIYPRVYNLLNFNLKSMQAYGTVTTKQKTYEDNTSVSDIRKYYPGDSIKKVHWKISAKKGGIYVKNYEMTGSALTYVFLDFKQDSFIGINAIELEERAVEASASIVYYMLKNSVSVEMFVNSSRPYSCKGRELKEISKFLDILCEVKPNGSRRMAEVLSKRVRLINRGASIIIVTGELTEEDLLAYCQIKEYGYDIILIYVSDLNMDEGVNEILINRGIPRFDINSQSDVKGVLEAL